MAKVELVKQEEKKPEWVPFVTVTLSKREAAGMMRAVGHHAGRVVPGGLYGMFKDIIGEEDMTFLFSSRESIGIDNIVSKELDEKFGPV